MKEPTLLDLLKNGVHFGHQTARWHPRMREYIFTSRNGIHIINLEKSLAHLLQAQQFAHTVASQGGTIIFIGTKRQAKDIVRKAAEESGAMFITERWLGGLFTNFAVVSKLMQRLRKLTDDRQAGRLEKYTNKERLGFDEEIAKLEKLVGGIRELRKLPQAVFVVDIKTEKTAVREAKKAGIPIIAMVDTNTDPEGIAYLIPSNDDATKSISLIAGLIGAAVAEGRAVVQQQAVISGQQPQEPAAPPSAQTIGHTADVSETLNAAQPAAVRIAEEVA